MRILAHLAHIARKSSIYLSIALFLASLIFCLLLGKLAASQSINPEQLVQQGVELYRTQDYQGAIAQWETALSNYQTNNDRINTAIVRENLARAYGQIGQIDKAIAYWEQVVDNYRQLGDFKQVGRMLVEQAQAYIQLGQNRRAIALLCGSDWESDKCLEGTALQIARQQKDSLGQVAALGSLGEAYRRSGEYDRAISKLESASQIDPSIYTFSVLNSLGNAYVARAQSWDSRAKSASAQGQEFQTKAEEFEQQASKDYQKAWQYFQSSRQNAIAKGDNAAQMRSLLNLIQLDSRFNSSKQNDIEQALVLLERLTDSPEKANAAMVLANLAADPAQITAPLAQCPIRRQLPDAQAESLLNKALNVARTIQDPRSESFALGALGHFYECRSEYESALKLTQEALLAADQNTSNKDSTYLWEWQTGRIFNAQGKQADAIAAYQRAFAILEKIRSDILVADRDVQFDFRDAIEPIYRQLTQLRLTSTLSLPPEQKERELTLALETIDSLRLAELQNYFGNDCNLAIPQTESIQTLISQDTAVFNSIILEDSAAVLLSLPNGKKEIHWVEENGKKVDRKTLEIAIKEFRDSLVFGIEEFSYDTTQAQKLYNWAIEPFETALNSAKIETLIFVQDGIFRTIPMSALYDGKQFLVEKYAIATTPSLGLIAARSSNSQNNRALILGVTKAAKVDEQSFDALANVPREIKEIQTQFPDNKLLLDEQFNRENLEKELNQSTYQIVHVATHAQFGFIPEDTFLVTGNNNKITINELEIALRQLKEGAKSVELLALTACQTATGDERAALGLAGVAVQTGVRSALASLWSVSDDATLALVTEFYRSLVNSGVSKAEALRTAQLKLIKTQESEEITDQYSSPAFWAPFILIGDWR
ncbi:MAG: CHAT domain-containing protein [Hydrococcus sp. C42_A2020_068]|nr:CHAT domain-containing protein [Hydrococcus sp. C42_A2020_068]